MATLRDRFPVLGRVAYLNAGTCGPVPAAAPDAASAELRREAEQGRTGTAHFDRLIELHGRLLAAYAARLGCDADELVLTSSTTDGLTIVLGGLDLGPGDEVLTSDAEHPGVTGPLQALRDLRGVTVRTAPLADLADAAGPATRAVVCSHVSWVTGEFAPTDALAALDAPLILDGAQGVGAVPVDVRELGCAAYAGSGQKWLCGPDGTGMLYVAPDFRDRVAATRRGYIALEDPNAGLDARPAAGMRRLAPAANHGAPLLAHALAAHDTLAAAGWEAVHGNAADLADRLASRLADRDRDVLPRGRTTLVAWRDPDPEAATRRLAEEGVAIRYLPGRGLLRASVGAWNDDSDLERLLAAL